MDLQLVFKTNNILFYKVSIELIDEYLELVNDKTIQRSTLTKEKEYSKGKAFKFGRWDYKEIYIWRTKKSNRIIARGSKKKN